MAKYVFARVQPRTKTLAAKLVYAASDPYNCSSVSYNLDIIDARYEARTILVGRPCPHLGFGGYWQVVSIPNCVPVGIAKFIAARFI